MPPTTAMPWDTPPPRCPMRTCVRHSTCRHRNLARPASDVIDELVERSTPGLRAMTGPRFFGWVIGASHPVGVAADWLTSAWGQNAGNHAASPAAAAAETVAAHWLLDLLDLPRECSVGFVTGATMANFVCLAAARGEVLRRVGWDVEADGLFGAPPIRVLIGEDAHTTRVRRAAVPRARARARRAHRGRCAGPHGARGVRARDRRRDGPTIVIAQAGQINTGAFDPIGEIVPMARARTPGCMSTAPSACGRAPCLERRIWPQGVEAADSWATDGHKWLQTPYDCGYAIVRDAEAHRRAMTIAASYLPPVAEASAIRRTSCPNCRAARAASRPGR